MSVVIQAALGRFVGRSKDQKKVIEHLTQGDRLITITGPGGIGKTRLAVELGRKLFDLEGTGEVLFCDLTEASDLAGLCDALSTALSIPEPKSAGGDDAIERLSEAIIARGPVLLIADNFDRLVSVAPAVERLLALVPDLRVLVTSRERLYIGGEIIHELGPLGLPVDPHLAAGSSEALELFSASAERVRKDWNPSKTDIEHIAEIVKLLDGIPLAIELAASRLAVMGPQALLHRLRSGFGVLGRTTGTERHRTLENALEWSWKLLEPWEREALEHCTVFRGGFTVDAAESVIDLSGHRSAPEVIDVIQALRDKSMLHGRESSFFPGELRLALYSPIREFAESKLEGSGKKKATEARHADFFVNFVNFVGKRRTTNFGESAAVRRYILTERENLLVVAERVLEEGPITTEQAEPALRALLALSQVLLVNGPLRTYSKIIEPVLEATAATGADPSLQGDALAVRGTLEWYRGENRKGLEDLLRALDLARKTGNRSLEGRVTHLLGQAFADRNEIDDARGQFEKALKIQREIGDLVGEGNSLVSLGQLEFLTGHVNEAQRLSEQALAVHQQTGDLVALASDHRLLAELQIELGEGDAARSHLDSSKGFSQKSDDRRNEALTWTALGLLAQDRGELDRAGEHYERASELLAELGFPRLEAFSNGLFGILCRQRGRWAEAHVFLNRTIALLKADADPLRAALFTAHLGGLEADAGRHHKASELIERAVSITGGRAQPWLNAVIELQRAHLDPARSEPIIQGAKGFAQHSVHVRIALRCLQGVLARDDHPQAMVEEPLETALLIGPQGKWFRAPGGTKVNLGRRKQLHQLMNRLTEARLASPGEPLNWKSLLEAGWPGESVIASAGIHRVRVALWTLRKLGLKDVLQTVEQGYLLDPTIETCRLEGA